MQAFLHGRHGRPNAAAVENEQPTEPVVRFFWLISAAGGNKKFECKLCRARFTGQKSTAITHFASDGLYIL
jgi:hypothetical protein